MEIKKLFAWAMIALPLLAACEKGSSEKEKEEGGQGTEGITLGDIAGEWYMNLSENVSLINESLVINSNGSFVAEMTNSYEDQGRTIISSKVRIEGRFILDGTSITGDVTKAQRLNQNGEWENTEMKPFGENQKVSLLRNGTVLLLTYDYKEDYPDAPVKKGMEFYYRKGATLPSDNSELQGTWFWMDKYMSNDKEDIRIALKFTGNNIDLIVAPWSQRFICEYTYKDGFVSSKAPITFRTLWKWNGSNPLNPEDPYDSEWLPTYDPDQYRGNLTEDGFSFPIIVDGDTAYSMFLGLQEIYTKQ